MRLHVFRVLIWIGFIVIASYIIFLQVMRGNHFYDLSINNRIRLVSVQGWRGKILDRHGFVLADNRRSFDVAIIPQTLDDADKTFAFLSETLNQNIKQLKNRFQRLKTRPFAPVIVMEDISFEQAMKIEEQSYRHPGLVIEKSFKRQYPYGKDTAHILGYVGKIDRSRLQRLKQYGYKPDSVIGYTGIEEVYDDHLQGIDGGFQVEVNSRGQPVRLLGIKRPQQGGDIHVTLDKDMQIEAAKLMADRVGVIIMMDQSTGEILTMVSSPAFDPNYFIDKKRAQPTSSFEKLNAPFINRAIKGAYPPGSVFKIPVAIAALDQEQVDPFYQFPCRGFLKVGDSRFGCAHVHGPQNMIESIVHSCNVYFYHLGLRLGDQYIYEYTKSFGLGEKTGIDLPYENKGFLPNRFKRSRSGKSWYAGDTLNFSIGQGDVLTTPLQLVKMMGTVANDGLIVQPFLLYKVDAQQVIFPEKLQLNLNDPDAYRIVRQGMRGAVKDISGTAHVLDIPGLNVAGKTGTAQSSPGKEDHSWFVGYVDSPKRDVVFAVFLEHGGSSYNACLLAKKYLVRLQERRRL